jgi:hypothetical protein
MPYILKIVVFAAGTDTFLGIDGTVIVAASSSKKNILELSHS